MKSQQFLQQDCGNIVKTLTGFGLIDIVDMKVYHWPFWLNTRLRNFKRLSAYDDDMASLGEAGWKAISMRYLEHSKLHASYLDKLIALFKPVI